MTSRLGLITAVMSACGVLAGCATDKDVQLPPAPAGATQPFDLYRDADMILIGDAQRKLLATCLIDKGYPQYSELLGYRSAPQPSLSEKPLFPRTEDDARTHGAGGRSSLQTAPPKITAPNDSGFEAIYDDCDKSSSDEIIDSQTYLQYGALRNTLANDNSGVEEIVRDHKDKVIDCLKGKDYVAAGGPDGKPESYGIKLGNADSGTYVPTPDESKFVTALTQCRQDTGLFAKVDEVWVTKQQAIIEKHAAEFAELNPKIEAAARKAAEVLAR